MPAEQAQPRHLHHGGVQIVGDQYAAQLIDAVEQQQGGAVANRKALRRVQAHPQGTQYRPDQRCQRNDQLDRQCFEKQQRKRCGQQQQGHAGQIAVAEQGQREQAAFVGGWVPLQQLLQPGDLLFAFRVRRRCSCLLR